MSTLNALLNELEDELRRLEYWSDVPPSAQAMASQEPFAVDTLSLPEWLQWIYLQRLRALLEANAELPTGALVKPYAEEYFAANRGPAGELIRIIDRIDAYLGRP
ncbi:MAG: YqcC family protein [Saccharospirillum sp.]|nr:YqcC family protein [Saccharospirillum sp.]